MLNRQVFADVKPLQPEDGGGTVLVNTIASCGDPGNGRGQNPVVRVIGPGRGQLILGNDRAVQHIHRIVVLRGDGDTGHYRSGSLMISRLITCDPQLFSFPHLHIIWVFIHIGSILSWSQRIVIFRISNAL